MKAALVVFAIALCLAAAAEPEGSSLYTEIHGNGVYATKEYAESDKRIREYEAEFRDAGFVRLAERTTEALDAIFYIAKRNLRRKGEYALEKEIKNGWEFHRQTLITFALNMGQGRPIGDFEPVSEWLKIAYEKIEDALGVEVCRALRLSDIKTINHAVPVVFRPCQFGEAEFNYHFIHDDVYRGLFPVVIYWVSSITCSMATFGAGYFFICSPIAMLIEAGADRVIAPWLAPKLYSWACE